MTAEFLEKLDVRQIVANHWRTLVDDSTQRTRPTDFVLFYGIPLVAPLLFVLRNGVLTEAALDVLATSLSILAGLLFNLLMLLHGLGWRHQTHPLSGTVKRLVSQLYANIAYSILIAIVTLPPLIVAANYTTGSPVTHRIAGALALWLVLHFVLTLGMVLKRIHTMLQDEFGRP